MQVAVFFSDIRFEGVSVSDKPSMIIGQPPGEPSFLISQEWLEKTGNTTPEEIAVFLEGEGFAPVAGSYFGWYRASDRMAVVDAKPDNFVKTAGGMMALDLQILQFTPDEARAAGLADESSQSTSCFPSS